MDGGWWRCRCRPSCGCGCGCTRCVGRPLLLRLPVLFLFLFQFLSWTIPSASFFLFFQLLFQLLFGLSSLSFVLFFQFQCDLSSFFPFSSSSLAPKSRQYVFPRLVEVVVVMWVWMWPLAGWSVLLKVMFNKQCLVYILLVCSVIFWDVPSLYEALSVCPSVRDTFFEWFCSPC